MKYLGYIFVMSATFLSGGIVSSTCFAAGNIQEIHYSCDEVSGDVYVRFNGDEARGLYGSGIYDVKDGEEETPVQARRAARELSLKVNANKSHIEFTIVTDEHEGETRDVSCNRVKK
ncbi:MAG: hypothetical protein ACXWQO_10325 [Bdellovibrionota bacterium]